MVNPLLCRCFSSTGPIPSIFLRSSGVVVVEATVFVVDVVAFLLEVVEHDHVVQHVRFLPQTRQRAKSKEEEMNPAHNAQSGLPNQSFG